MLIVDQEKLRFNRVKREMDPSSWQKHHFEWDFLCSLRFNGFQVCWWCFGEICEVSPYLHVPGSLVLLVKDGRTKSCLDPAPILPAVHPAVGCFSASQGALPCHGGFICLDMIGQTKLRWISISKAGRAGVVPLHPILVHIFARACILHWHMAY